MLIEISKRFSNRVFLRYLAILSLVFGLGIPSSSLAQEPEIVNIGVLAKRGKDITKQRWSATAIYLTKLIPTKRFNIVPLKFDEVDAELDRESIDFVLVNPAMYVQLESTYNVSRIATLVSNYSSNSDATLGSVIISRSDSLTLSSSNDILYKSVAAVSPRSLGGWQIALGRLSRDDIDIQSDLKNLRFLGTHDLVIQAVLKGAADVGIVRTGTLEQMEAEGKINLQDFSILPSDETDPEFTQLTSTGLYPDWAFAKSAHVDDVVARQVAAALLVMNSQDEAAYTADISGWTTPKHYASVHALLKELKIPPYQKLNEDDDEGYLLELASEHTSLVFSVITSFIVLIFMYFRQKVLTKELRHAQNSLKNYSNRLQLAAAAGELGIWEWNVKQDKFYSDDRTSQIFGVNKPDNVYTSYDWFSRVHPDDIDKVQTAMNLSLSDNVKFDVEYRIVKSNNEFCAVRSAAIHRYSKSRNGLVVNGVTWDISNHQRLVEENKKLATLDPLTNAKNRRGFFPLARAEFNRCRRYGNRLALLMIDIDNFKQINDVNGHSTGDASLVTLSEICHSVFRNSDLFCRMGGEEFIALLHENTIDQAQIVAERLRKEIENASVTTKGISTKFTVSIGISVLIESDQTIEDTISRADKALYKAKQQGKNCIVSDI
ncbi:diguanylate cyclase [Vibrio algarum]|uniref:diguanylate cyclase n=1 Tax=Vibrio algarum TaxID=3020714 RepID=A0ABT4YXK6_9VIBR|nr:diguanylate cyclase [Vibrio sp. KJ40-1]MDB1126320.1 diguanylate cyclase [Vibrio sp. KJ40-1]